MFRYIVELDVFVGERGRRDDWIVFNIFCFERLWSGWDWGIIVLIIIFFWCFLVIEFS